MITYKQQRDKLINAYIECRVNPFDECACFIGNLLNGKDRWSNVRCRTGKYDFYSTHVTLRQSTLNNLINIGIECIQKESEGLYNVDDIIQIEQEFLRVYNKNNDKEFDSLNEDALFLAFERGLEVLKQIHLEKGEIIEEYVPFVKREVVA